MAGECILLYLKKKKGGLILYGPIKEELWQNQSIYFLEQSKIQSPTRQKKSRVKSAHKISNIIHCFTHKKHTMDLTAVDNLKDVFQLTAIN